MKESLLCSVLVFLADTPKSAGKHVIQGKPEISQRNTTVIIYFTNAATWCCSNTLFTVARLHHALFVLRVSNGSSVSWQADAQAPLYVWCVTGQNACCVVSLSLFHPPAVTVSTVDACLCAHWAAGPNNCNLCYHICDGNSESVQYASKWSSFTVLFLKGAFPGLK